MLAWKMQGSTGKVLGVGGFLRGGVIAMVFGGGNSTRWVIMMVFRKYGLRWLRFLYYASLSIHMYIA